jgi:hypothetical protein
MLNTTEERMSQIESRSEDTMQVAALQEENIKCEKGEKMWRLK